MKSKRILVPVDILHDRTHPLLLVQQMAAEVLCSVTLLYVCELNIATPDRRLPETICAEGEAALRTLPQ